MIWGIEINKNIILEFKNSSYQNSNDQVLTVVSGLERFLLIYYWENHSLWRMFYKAVYVDYS